MDVFKETTGSKHYLVYKVIGGIFDFRFFLSEQSPEATVEKFNFYSGQAPIPPFWSLGFHQSRWGYQNISFLTDVI
jgi:alpha-glucosidase (family GH31 glycosyl hydrolase)